jgi:HSP20 family protein
MLTLWKGFNGSLANDFRRMDRMFDSFVPAAPRAANLPRVDLNETNQGFELVAEVPGLTADDVKVTLHDGVLSLDANVESKVEDKDDDKKTIYRERRSLSFSRRFRLGDEVDGDQVSATVKDGVLTVQLPKKAVVQPKQIAVNGN